MREFYGFVLYLTTFLVSILYLCWSFLSDSVLHSIGITYYPSRTWAIVVPFFIVSLIPFTILVFTANNLMKTPSLNQIEVLTDQHARMMSLNSIAKILDPSSIPDLEDVPLNVVNKCWKHERC
ncbi:PIG-P [Globomyces pollinis-pini]|nr:PIG-P [Globomyces pollinis-pini]